MQFRIDQRFDLPLESVEAALAEPGFYEAMAAMPKVGRVTLLSCDTAGETVHLRVRYAFAGDLSPAVRRVVDPARLTWVTDSRTDRRTHRSEFEIEPDAYAHLLRCHGYFVLRTAGEGCVRTATGEMRVSVPLVGGKVEQAIVSGLRDHAAAEAELVRSWIADHPRP